MHTQDLFIDKCAHWQAVKRVREYFPEFNRVPTLALVIKPVNTVYLGTFVVPSEHEEVLRVLYFVGHEETYSLDRLFSAIDVISQKEIVRFRRETTVFKYT